MTDKVIFLTSTAASSWTVPDDWSDINTIELLAGGAGAGGNSLANGTGGAGAGAYSKITNLTGLTPGGSVDIGIGAAGVGATTIAGATNGGDTWFNGTGLGSASVSAEGGKKNSGANGTTGGVGGQASNGIGTVKKNGGSGGSQTAGTPRGAGGGGGAGGPDNDGANGGTGDLNGNAAGAGGGGANTTNTAPAATTSSNGGNGPSGSGGGAQYGGNATSGSGGGGAGAEGSVPGGNGAQYDLWTQTSDSAVAGPGGGGGGAGANNATNGNGGNAGGYGAGGGGASSRGTGTGGNGTQGLIVITYKPAPTGGSVQADTATASGTGEVLVEGAGSVTAGSATASGAGSVLVEGEGSAQAATAETSATAHARAIVTGSVSAGPATAGGVVEPPPFQIAVEALRGKVYIVELLAQERSETREALIWLDIACFNAACMEPDDDVSAGTVTFRLSNTGYISPNSGTYSNTHFDGRVEQPLQISRTLIVAPEGGRRVAIETGEVRLINSDGFFDNPATQYAVDGREVRVLFGLDSYTYDKFTPIFTGRAVAWNASFDDLVVQVRDRAYELERPLHDEIFAGTGGYEGTDALTGRRRPCCFGEVSNISPLMINPTLLIYQVHFREIEAVDAVYDRGAELDFVSDEADYADLAALSLSTGEYATCLALGLIRLGSTASLLTADVQGDADGGYVDTTAEIIERILIDLGGVNPANIDDVAFADFETAVPGVIGWYETAILTIAEAVERTVGHCGGVWGADFNGRYWIYLLSAPDSTDIVDYIDEADVIDIDRTPPVSGTYPPRAVQRVNYARNFTPMTGEDIAGAVSDAERDRLQRHSSSVFASSEAVRTENLLAREPSPLESLFRDAEDAQDLADHWLALLSAQRSSFRVTVDERGYLATLGETVRLTHPRVGAGSKDMRVIDIEVNAADETIDLLLWG